MNVLLTVLVALAAVLHRHSPLRRSPGVAPAVREPLPSNVLCFPSGRSLPEAIPADGPLGSAQRNVLPFRSHRQIREGR